MPSVVPPRGMRDFLPAEKRQREAVAHVIRRAFQAHGFEEIETPVMETAERLHAGLGGDNEKLAYGVQRRGLTVDDLQAAQSPLDLTDLGLRFDLTVPLARFYASNRASLPQVVRAIQMAPVWRAERPQAGRFRQFQQCDIDIIGEAGPQAELELLAATGDTLRRLGLDDAVIRVNDRRVLDAVLEHADVPPAERGRALIAIDKLDKIGVDGVRAELDACGLDGEVVLAGLDSERLRSDDFGGALDTIDLLLAAQDDVGVRVELDPTLVRGMGYYTGAIFEIAHASVPYSIGGGGRYDGMIGRFLGQDVPAVGISFGFERLIDLVSVDSDAGAETIALVHDRDVPPTVLVSLKRALVEQGKDVRVARRSKNVTRVLDELAASGATHVAFVRADTTLESLETKPLATS